MTITCKLIAGHNDGSMRWTYGRASEQGDACHTFGHCRSGDDAPNCAACTSHPGSLAAYQAQSWLDPSVHVALSSQTEGHLAHATGQLPRCP